MGRYKKSDTSQEAILEAAIRVLAKRGYAATSVSDIARAARMSKGTVHYHFESKDDLLRAVLGRCFAVTSGAVRTAWEAGGAPNERIRRTLRAMWAMRRGPSDEMKVFIDLMTVAVHDPRMRDMFRALLEQSRALFVAELLGCFERLGMRSKVAPAVVPRLVLGALDGLALHHLFDPADEAEEAEIMKALELLTFALFEF